MRSLESFWGRNKKPSSAADATNPSSSAPPGSNAHAATSNNSSNSSNTSSASAPSPPTPTRAAAAAAAAEAVTEAKAAASSRPPAAPAKKPTSKALQRPDRLFRFLADSPVRPSSPPILSTKDQTKRETMRKRMIGFVGDDGVVGGGEGNEERLRTDEQPEPLFLSDDQVPPAAEFRGTKRSQTTDHDQQLPAPKRSKDDDDDVIQLSDDDDAEDDEQGERDNQPSTTLAKFAATEPTRAGRQPLPSNPPPSKKVPTKGKGKGKAGNQRIGPSGLPYSPLEEQILEIKQGLPGVILIFEIGYKLKFYGDDAKVASQLLNVACFTDRNMASAMISPTKLHIHIRTLIHAGLKVGVVKQMETRALKAASTNASKPFTRQVTAIYTASTWVDDMEFDEGSSGISSSSSSSAQEGATNAPPTTTNLSHHSLVSIVEREGGEDPAEKTRIGIVANYVSTGEIVWDEFDDAALRSELDTRLAHFSPVELLLPTKLTHRTEQVLQHYASRGTSDGQLVRVERMDRVPDYNGALTLATETMTSGQATGGRADEQAAEQAVAVVQALPRLTVQSFAASIEHLKSFGLAALFQRASRVRSFANRTTMLLTSGTLANLEVLESSNAAGTAKASRVRGSLIWLIDRCRSHMGKRRLREWLSRPLCDAIELEARADAIQEIATKVETSATLSKALNLLVGQPDLEKGLARVSYGRAGPAELARILLALHRVATQFTFASEIEVPLETPVLKQSILQLSRPVEVLAQALKAINISAAMKSDKVGLFDLEHIPEVMHDLGNEMAETQELLRANQAEFDQHLKELRVQLKRPALQYASVAEKEFLIEVTKQNANRVPSTWFRINATSKVVRFHTPRILELLRVREQLKETLADQANSAYNCFVTDLTGNANAFIALRDSVQALARLDALASLARLSSLPGWSRPSIVPSTLGQPSTLRLDGFRHPMSEALMDHEYVPNSIKLGGASGGSDAAIGEGTKGLLITGSNMGGKSSTVRAMALCVLLAQVGAAVPAAGAELSLFDSILTRMGASDDLAAGRSTFQTELEETGEVLRTATNRSLVVLDELGRGTSTHDGMAIAYATFKHLMGLSRERCPMTLFITHYFSLGQLQDDPETLGRIRNMHMAYHLMRPSPARSDDSSFESSQHDASTDEYAPGSQLVFLYKLRPGLASSSFGIHCAAAAGLPLSLLERAQRLASHLQARSAQLERRQHAYDALRQVHDLLAC